MGKKGKLSIIIIVVTLFCIILGFTTALFKWNSNNSNVGFQIQDFDAYIIYEKGNDILSGTLNPVLNYSNSSIYTQIQLYKSVEKTLYGHLYLDVNSIGTNIANEASVKWVVVSNNVVLNSGNFIGSQVGDSIPILLNIPLNTSLTYYKVYVWLDENMEINEDMEGEPLSLTLRAEASEVLYNE